MLRFCISAQIIIRNHHGKSLSGKAESPGDYPQQRLWEDWGLLQYWFRSQSRHFTTPFEYRKKITHISFPSSLALKRFKYELHTILLCASMSIADNNQDYIPWELLLTMLHGLIWDNVSQCWDTAQQCHTVNAFISMISVMKCAQVETTEIQFTQQLKILSSFTRPHVVPYLTFFLLRNIKADHLRNVCFFLFFSSI